MATLTLLTDEDIIDYSGNNVLTDHRDFDLSFDEYLHWHHNGVYDARIFGSYYKDQCVCGRTLTVGKRCIHCNSILLNEVDRNTRWARIELPCYYLNYLRFDPFVAFISELFGGINTEKMIDKSLFSQGNRLITLKLFDTCQFEYDSTKKILYVTDEITDHAQCSYEGLLQLIQIYFPDSIKEYLKYVNKYVLVTPIVGRPFNISVINGEKVAQIHPTSSIYQSIIFTSKYISNIDESRTEASEKSALRAVFRNFMNVCIRNMSDILKPSKQNMSRMMYSNRVENSGRAPIVADPNLKIDEVSIPIHLAYEICKDEFVVHLADRLKISQEQASMMYRTDYDKVLDIFKEFATDRVVIINRNPTLHEYNMMALKMKLTTNYTMGLPPQICKPFNADFDGDSMSFYLIPGELQSYVYEKMSPKHLLIYKKSLKPLFVPSHEILNGLVIASKIQHVDDPTQFNSFEEIEKAYNDQLIEVYTMIQYNNEYTTYGREKISKIIEADLDNIIPDKKSIDSANVLDLVASLNSKDNRVDIIKELQDFALEIVTLEGVTSPNVSQLYRELPKEYLDKIKSIESDVTLNDQQKLLKAEKVHFDYLEHVKDTTEEVVLNKVKESDRMKIHQLFSVNSPQLLVKPNGKLVVTGSSLAQGMSERDYIQHAIENRSIQDIKVASVPMSGYLTRQCVILAQNYKFSESEDPNNKGILIPAYRAEGRTSIEGNLVGRSNSKSLIKVRSVITSTLKTDVITKDMITTKLVFSEGDNIGVSLISSLTESMTQAGLALKHGGRLMNINPNNELRAKEDCKLILDDKWIRLEGSSRTYVYPKPSNFLPNFSLDSTYKEGEVVGYAYKLVNPSYNLDSIGFLIGTKSVRSSKYYARNKVVVTDCYVLEEGNIKYEESNGSILAVISGVKYEISPEVMCYYSEGDFVPKYTRLSSGLVNMGKLFSLTNEIADLYYIFRDQFLSLKGDTTEELMEFLFKLITSEDQGVLKYQGVVRSIHQSESFFLTLSFENAPKSVRKAIQGRSVLLEDTFTGVTLNLLMNNNIK